MKLFKDTEGREWQISLTIGSIKRVKDLLNINLLEPEVGDPPLLQRLGTDDELLINTIFALIKPKADERQVSDVQFAESMGGESMLKAQTAFYEELQDFFQSRGRLDRAKMAAKQRTVIDLAIAAAAKKIEMIDATVEIEKRFSN